MERDIYLPPQQIDEIYPKIIDIKPKDFEKLLEQVKQAPLAKPNGVVYRKEMNQK